MCQGSDGGHTHTKVKGHTGSAGPEERVENGETARGHCNRKAGEAVDMMVVGRRGGRESRKKVEEGKRKAGLQGGRQEETAADQARGQT